MCLQVLFSPASLQHHKQKKAGDDEVDPVPLCLEGDFPVTIQSWKSFKPVKFTKVDVNQPAKSDSLSSPSRNSTTIASPVKNDTPTDNDNAAKLEKEASETSPKSSSGAVRRPMNSFMVFARQHRASVQKAHPERDNKAISRLLGDAWSSLTGAERQAYVDMANDLAQQHKKDHPNYKFRRVLKRKQKPSKPSTTQIALQPHGTVRSYSSSPIAASQRGSRPVVYGNATYAPCHSWDRRRDSVEESMYRDALPHHYATLSEPSNSHPPWAASFATTSSDSLSSLPGAESHPYSVPDCGSTFSSWRPVNSACRASVPENGFYYSSKIAGFNHSVDMVGYGRPKKSGCLWTVESMLN